MNIPSSCFNSENNANGNMDSIHCVDSDGAVIIDTDEFADDMYLINNDKTSFIGYLSPHTSDTEPDAADCVICKYVNKDHQLQHATQKSTQDNTTTPANTTNPHASVSQSSTTYDEYTSSSDDEFYMKERATLSFDAQNDSDD
jgi:hypothetical protein